MSPTLLLASVREAGSQLLAFARATYARNPVRVNAVIAAAAVAVCGRVGFVLPQLSVLHVTELVAPILLGGEHARRHVSPTHPTRSTHR